MESSLSYPSLLPWGLTALFLAILLLVVVRRKPAGRGVEHLEARLEELGRISTRLEELHSMFTLPYVRGGVGETLLEELLRNWLPGEAFELQHTFRDGGRADAVVKMGRYRVAIDAKFPLQSVQQALEVPDEAEEDTDAPRASEGRNETSRSGGGSNRAGRAVPPAVRRTFLKHAGDISEKYIRPEEGTLQFAIMYVPSERVYYRCFVEDAALAGELLRLHVVPTGPSALFLYLQTVAYGLRGFAMPERAQELNATLYELRKASGGLAKDLNTAAGHLKNLTGSLDAVERRERSLQRIIDRLEEQGGAG